MPSQKNVQKLDEVKQKVNKSTAMFFVDYAGLTHRQLEEVRRELSENESEISIVKNTLMNIALKDKIADAKVPMVDAIEDPARMEFVGKKLQGPHATLFSYGDPIKTTKVLAAFVKKFGLPKIKFGLFSAKGGSASGGEGWNLIDEAMIMKLSMLPSREVLIAKLLGILNAPISNFVYGLNANIIKLAMILDQIKNKKENIKNTN